MKAPHNKQIAEPKKMPADAYALIVQLRKEIARLLSENTKLREEIARLKKNSSNSSKPPSSDIVKPPRKMPADSKKHKQGAQKGHPRHNRPLLPPNQIDEHCHKEQDCCPDCGRKLQKTGRPPKVTQQIELVEKPFKVVEYLCDEYWCEHCRRYHTAKLSEVEKGLFGLKLQSLITVMKGRGHLSYTTLQEILATVFKIKVSTGYLAKIIQGVRWVH